MIRCAVESYDTAVPLRMTECVLFEKGGNYRLPLN